MNIRRTLLSSLMASGLLLAGLAPQGVLAQQASDFPSKPVKFIVPFPPGSATDSSARYFARKFTEVTGQTVVVDNKPGANGFIAVKAVLSAPADGYTVFIGSNSTLAVNAALFKQLPYDPVADFTPLSMLTRTPAMLIVQGQSEFKTMKDLMAGAKAKPGQLNFGAGSAGYQLMAEAFSDAANVNTVHVPFKGASEAVTAVAAGTVHFSFVEMMSAIEMVKGGKLRALAVASERRPSALSGVPTATEAGLPGFTAYAWVAAVVSAKTPKAEADKLASIFTAIERQPETKESYERTGAEVMNGGPEEMRTFQNAEIKLWKRIAAKAKVELQ